MTARELLKTIVKLRKRIDNKNVKIQILLEKATNASPRALGTPHSPGPETSPMEAAICDKIDLEREVEELKNERNELIKKIDLLENDDYKTLLLLRYVKEEHWDMLACKMGYSERHIFRLHIKAVEELDVALKDVSKCQQMSANVSLYL